jgi:hypothetical protein
MFHPLRRHLRVLAAAVLVLVSAFGGGSSLAHGIECHDTDCGPVAVAHDASAHAFRSAELPGGERGLHCVLCHWTRAFRPGVQSAAAAPALDGRTLVVAAAAPAPARLTAAAQPPLRAPPSASTLAVVA